MKKFNLFTILFSILLWFSITWCWTDNTEKPVSNEQVGKSNEISQPVNTAENNNHSDNNEELWELKTEGISADIEPEAEVVEPDSDTESEQITQFVEDEVFTSDNIKDANVKQFQEKQEEIQELVESLMNDNPEMRVVQQEITQLIQKWTVQWEEFWELQKKFEWFFTEEIKKLDWEIRVLYDDIIRSQQASLANHPKFKEYQEKWEKLQKMYQELMSKNLEMKEISWKLELLAWQWETSSLEFQKLQSRFESFLTSDMRELEKEVTELYSEITQ